MTTMTVLRTDSSRDTCSSRANAGTHRFAMCSFCRHNFPAHYETRQNHHILSCNAVVSTVNVQQLPASMQRCLPSLCHTVSTVLRFLFSSQATWPIVTEVRSRNYGWNLQAGFIFATLQCYLHNSSLCSKHYISSSTIQLSLMLRTLYFPLMSVVSAKNPP